MEQAELTTLFLVGLAVGALALARVLLNNAGDAGNNRGFDDSLATYANRNVALPYVLGRRRLGATVVSVWGRRLVRETVGRAGGKGSGGGQSIPKDVYFENAVHFISLGPCARLRKIIQAGKVIWSGDAGPDANGTFSADLGSEGSFTFYFGGGETDLKKFHRKTRSGELIVEGRSKWIVACEWSNKRLGNSASWPQIEYEIECTCGESLPGSSLIIAPGPKIAIDRGLNPAHIIWQLLTAPFPHGAGMGVDTIDKTSLEALGVLCESEEIAFNLLIDSQSLEEVLADMLNVLGVYMAEKDGRLLFVPIRYEATVPTLDDDDIAAPLPEVTVSMGEEQPTRVVMSFPDARQGYRTNSSLSLDDDGQAARFSNYKVQRLTTNSVTSKFVMDVVARRKINEAFGDKQSVKLVGLHGSHLLSPGQAVEVQDIGRMRVSSVKLDTLDYVTDLGLVFDSFGVPDTDDSSDDIDTGGTILPVAEDLFFDVFQIDGTLDFAVIRIRAHSGIVGATISADVDSDIFVSRGSQNASGSGGPIRSAIAIGATSPIENGPIIDPYTEDIDQVLNLTGNTADHEAGRQLCVINGEIFYLRNIDLVAESTVARSTSYSVGDYVVPPTPTGLRYECVAQTGPTGANEPAFWPDSVNQPNIIDGGVEWKPVPFAYQLKGLIRAQEGSSAEAHAIGDVAAIIERDNLIQFSDPRNAASSTLCVKSVPFTESESVDPSSVTAVCKVLS